MSRVFFKNPKSRRKPKDITLIYRFEPSQLEMLSKMFPQNKPLAFDFETTGLNPVLDTEHIRSVGLANFNNSIAIDFSDNTREDIITFLEWMENYQLIAHNMNFDVAWIYKYLGRMPKMECCTMGLFKQLSTEGWAGQTWGLKVAMTEILGWKDANEDKLYQWLKENKLKKSEMSKAPWEILGPYNLLDAYGTYQLYEELIMVCKRNRVWGESLIEYHKEDFMNELRLLVESQFAGIAIDGQSLEALDRSLEDRAEGLKSDFFSTQDVVKYVDKITLQLKDRLKQAEPEKVTKTGKVSVRWQKWHDKMQAPIENPFNIDSPMQLADFFYNEMGFVVQTTTPKGLPSVNAKSLKNLGPLGRVLMSYRKLRDERKFVSSLQKVQHNGRLHPSMKIPGTLTGRLAGGIETK